MKEKKERLERDPIPENPSREELAHFWDTHSIADYWDELKPVKVKVAKNLSKIISIRLDDQTFNKLQKEAQKRKVGPTTFARMILAEHATAQKQ